MDPFIFASQAKQVFYSRESKTSNWYVVLKAPPRGFYENATFNEDEYTPCAPFDVSQLGHNIDDEDCVRRDCEPVNYASVFSDRMHSCCSTCIPLDFMVNIVLIECHSSIYMLYGLFDASL